VSVLGEVPDSEITVDHLKKMSYMEQVIKETLRLNSPSMIIERHLTSDLHLEGVVIPEGTNVIVSSPTLHKDPNYFPEPSKFDPERFAMTSNQSAFHFLPFSAGPRGCIGRAFAIRELKLVLSIVVRALKLESVTPLEGIRLEKGTLNVKCLSPPVMKFHARTTAAV